MVLIELFHFLVRLQVTPVPTAVPGACTDCATSAFTAIGAAYATEGYYLQSDIIFQILNTDFGLFAPMLYIIAAFGGLIGLATGSPPRTYMWFFMGPAIYSWLIDNTHPVSGVNWMIANRPQLQTQVWKLSEAGLNNVNHAAYDDFTVYSTRQPNHPAEVSTVFLWFDELVSSTAQSLTEWTGIHHQGGRGGADTNLADRSGSQAEGKHYLLSNLKWGLVENITDARLHNVDVRDAFVTFMASECGDRFGEVLDQASVISAQNTRGENLTTDMSIFVKQSGGTPNYQLATTNLGYQYVPTPQSLLRMINGSQSGAGSVGTQADGSFLRFLSGAFGGASNPTLNESISCQQYLALLTQAFRWEAGHIYHQLVSNVPQGLGPGDIVYNLFYGWDIKIGRTTSNGGSGTPSAGQTLTEEEYSYFLNDLILVHLYRNEMAMAPQAVDARFASSTKAENFAKAYARTTGNRAKYAEVYTWALMIPHVQGILLFLLAAGYPVACLLVVIPGMHKSILTWAKFWLWVKMWDVGFAIVMVLERSVWAMLGNGSNFSRTSDLITQMQQWGRVLVGCPNTNGSTQNISCSIPQVVSSDGANFSIVFGPWGFPQAIPTSSQPQLWENMLKTLDRSMVLAANLDLDLSNSYYIYIMSALYFAVPAVTGQVILGAQAGMASLATNAMGSMAQEVGKSAGSSMGSEAVTALHNNMSSVGQAAHAKSLRESGLGRQAIEYGNQGLRSEMGASALNTAGQNQALMKDQFANSNQSRLAGLEAIASQDKLAAKGFNAAGALADKAGGGLLGAAANGLQKMAPGNSTVGNIANGLRTAASIFGAGTASGAAGRSSSNGGNGGAPGLPDNVSTGLETTGAPAMNQLGDGPGSAGTTVPPAKGTPGTGSGSSAGGSGSGPGRDPKAPSVVGSGGPGIGSRGGSALANAATALADPAHKAGRNQSIQNSLGQLSNSNGMLADMNVGGFAQSQFGKGYGAASSRSAQAAGFKAEQDSWDARNRFSSQISGQAVALGHFIGGMSAGPKPTGSAEGMALNNMLGSQAKKAANYVMPTERGGFFDSAVGTTAGLNRDFGGNRVLDAYQGATPVQMGAYALKAESCLVGDIATGQTNTTAGGGRSGSQINRDTHGGQNVVGSKGDAGRGSEPTRAAMAAGEAGLNSIGLGALVPNDGTKGSVGASNSGAATPTERILGPIR